MRQCEVTGNACDRGCNDLACVRAAEAPEDGWEWALVEIMGHRSHAGRCREVERFGAKMIRIDVPIKGDPVKNGWETHLYSGASLFSYTPTDEDSVMRSNTPYEPPSRYRLPAPADDSEAEREARALADEANDFAEVDELPAPAAGEPDFNAALPPDDDF